MLIKLVDPDQMVTNFLSLKYVQLEQQKIVPGIRKSSQIYLPILSEFTGSNPLLTLENQQVIDALIIE
jgi:hypothetical protein